MFEAVIASGELDTNPAPRSYGLVILDLGPMGAVAAGLASVLGAEVRYLRTSLRSPRARWLLARLRIEALALEREPRLRRLPHSFARPVWAADAYLRAIDLDPALTFFASQWPAIPDLDAALRIALLKSLTQARQELYIVDMWLQLRGYRHQCLLTSDGATRRVARHLDSHPRAPWWPKTPRVARHIAARIRSGTGRARVERVGDSGSQELEPESPLRVARAGPAEAIFVSNMENSYGALYRYDYLYSEEPESPLHPSRMALMARPWDNFTAEIAEGGFPNPGSRGTRIKLALRLLGAATGATRMRSPLWVLMYLARFLTSAEMMARQIREHYPDTTAAAFGFDSQVPLELAVAFELAGIETFAVSERPANNVDHSSIYRVGRLGTASPCLSEAALQNWSLSIREAEAIGMWRTDLLVEGMAADVPECISRARRDGRRIAVALPYHLSHDGDMAEDPVAKSAPSVAHFLQDLLELALRCSDLHIVIRGKNAHWLDDPRFLDIAAQINAMANIEVNTDYVEYNEAYRLCAHADLVIAKPTSLAEETLALGIPSLMHDYTHNLQAYAIDTWTHLPRDLWCLDKAEFHSRVDAVLADGGESFRSWWEPHRQMIYGSFNDGQVRERARQSFLSLVRRP